MISSLIHHDNLLQDYMTAVSQHEETEANL